MPRLWSDTIATHRAAVRDAAIDVTTGLVHEHGLRAVTMSEIAERTGIGRATLYKYFPDVESILRDWHAREISRHLEHLAEARDQAKAPAERLRAVLATFASLAHASHRQHDYDLAAVLHRDADQVAQAEGRVRALIEEVLREGVADGAVRSDVATEELAAYCLHALAAARTVSTEAALRRLVDVTLDGLRPAVRRPKGRR